MIYLVIQINNEQPSVTPFRSIDEMRNYVKDRFGDKSVAGVTENMYILHIKTYPVNKE